MEDVEVRLTVHIASEMIKNIKHLFIVSLKTAKKKKRNVLIVLCRHAQGLHVDRRQKF